MIGQPAVGHIRPAVFREPVAQRQHPRPPVAQLIASTAGSPAPAGGCRPAWPGAMLPGRRPPAARFRGSSAPSRRSRRATTAACRSSQFTSATVRTRAARCVSRSAGATGAASQIRPSPTPASRCATASQSRPSKRIAGQQAARRARWPADSGPAPPSRRRRHPVGIGQRQQQANGFRPLAAFPSGADPQQLPPAPRRLIHPGAGRWIGQPAPRAIAARAAEGLQDVQPGREIAAERRARRATESRSPDRAARSAASAPWPSAAPRRSRCASRGWVGSSAKSRPVGVMRPCSSSASSSTSKARAWASDAGRRRIEPGQRRRVAARPMRQFQRQRRQIGVENFRRCAAAATGSGWPRSTAGSRPGPSRPARPARCSAASAREMRTVSNRVRPLRGSKRGTRVQPASTTTRTPSMVRLVSAMGVASTILRRPVADRAGWRAAGRRPADRRTAEPAASSAQAGSAASRRRIWRISPPPGRNTSRSPAWRDSASQHGAHHDVEIEAIGIARQVMPGHRIGAAFAGDDGCVAQQPGHRRAVQRRRHHQQSQVLAQAALAVQAQGQGQIGVQTALVEFVENDQPHAVQRRIASAGGGSECPRSAPRCGSGAIPGSRSGCDSRRFGRPIRPAGWPCAPPPPAPPAGAAPAAGCTARPATARRAAPAARGWSCPRPAALARPERRHRGARPGFPARPVRWAAGWDRSRVAK